MTDETTEARPSATDSAKSTAGKKNSFNPSIDKTRGPTRITPEKGSAANAEMSPEQSSELQSERPSETLAQQSMSERAAKPSNPLEIPYDDVSPDSEEYKHWRRTQYRHGIRNLLLSLVVFGGLAILYWFFIHQA